MSERVREKTKRKNEHALTSFTCFVLFHFFFSLLIIIFPAVHLGLGFRDAASDASGASHRKLVLPRGPGRNRFSAEKPEGQFAHSAVAVRSGQCRASPHPQDSLNFHSGMILTVLFFDIFAIPLMSVATFRRDSFCSLLAMAAACSSPSLVSLPSQHSGLLNK